MNALRNKVQLIGNLGNDPEIVNLENGSKRKIPFEGPKDQYLFNCLFAPDGRLLVNRTNRHQNHLQIMAADLETGIEYTSENMFEHANYKEGGKPVKISATPNPELEFEQELVGVVRRCRLITLVGFPRMRMQTHIEYEVV